MLQEQIGQEVETMGLLEARSSLNRRGRGHEQIDHTFAARPRVKGMKASDDVVAADMVCVGARILR